MIDVAAVPGRARTVVSVVLRGVLPVLWLVWAGLAWWTAPRQVPAEQWERDVAAGRVVTAQRADGWSVDLSFWGAQPQPNVGATGWLVVWTVPNGQIRYADVGTFVTPDVTPALVTPDVDAAPDGDGDFDGEGVGSAGYGIGDLGVSPAAYTWGSERGLAHRLAITAALLAAVIGLVWLFMLVAGPAPAAGTRWFWFWIGLLPFGLGVLAYWFREWRFAGHPEWEGRGGRSGWLGLGWLIFGGIALSLLVFVAQVVLGRFLVPG